MLPKPPLSFQLVNFFLKMDFIRTFLRLELEQELQQYLRYWTLDLVEDDKLDAVVALGTTPRLGVLTC